MKGTIKIALISGAALTIALAGAAVNAHPEGGRDGGFGYGMGAGMGYGMGSGDHMGYGMGPGYHMGPGYGMAPGGMFAGNSGAVTARLDSLKSALGITDNQQQAWQAFAGSVTKQAESRRAWFDQMHESQTPRTAPDRLTQRSEAMKQHQADLESVTTALKKLYDVLTPEQRTVLDREPVAHGPRLSRSAR